MTLNNWTNEMLPISAPTKPIPWLILLYLFLLQVMYMCMLIYMELAVSSSKITQVCQCYVCYIRFSLSL